MTGHKKERSPGVWSLVIYLGRDHTGKKRYKWATFHGGERAAQRELNRLLAEAQSGQLADPARLKVAAYLERWLSSYAKPNVSPRTYERYEEIVQKHLIPALGHHLLVKLQPVQIQDYYTTALKSGRRDGKGGLSAQTVLHHHRLLHSALKQAVRWRILTWNPAEHVDPPPPESREMNAITEEKSLQLLDAAAGDRLYIPVLLAVTTGMRLGEILALRWQDIEPEAGLIRVNRSLEQTRDGLRFKEPKKKSRRTFIPPAFVFDELRVHKGEQACIRLQIGNLYQDHGLVVAQPTGEPWSVTVMSKAFEHLAAKAGMPEIRFHDLRHSNASQLLSAGVPIDVVSRRLGHQRTSTTQNIYGHLLPGQQEDAAARHGEAFGKARARRKDAG